MSCFLGIDVGTSGIKVLIVDEIGKVLASGYSECGNVISSRPGWAEQNPLDWWRACDLAVREALSQFDSADEITGIGLSGQMQGCVLLDKELKLIGNCIIWLDQRADSIVSDIERKLPCDSLLDINASYCLNSYWAPKLLWLMRKRPMDFDRIHKVVFPKDYVRLRMTGELVTDVSDASMTYLFDVPKRQWSKKMFDLLGLPIGIVPERVEESSNVVGYLTKEMAEAWNIPAGIPVVAGAGDQIANGIGNGIFKEGVIGISIGTSGVVFGCSDSPFILHERSATYSMCHAVPDKWSFLGLSLMSGGSFKWLRDNLFKSLINDPKMGPADLFDYMRSFAVKAPIGCEGLVFLPYLNGEKTPINDSKARGVWFGLSQRHSLNEIVRSVMEGVTFALRDSVELIRQKCKVERIVASGGGSKNELSRQLQADIFGSPIDIMNIDEGPAVGACILAGVGAKVFRNVAEGCNSILKVQEIIEPDSERVKIYDDYYQTYRMLYPALKDLYAKQATLVEKTLENGQS